MRFPISFTAAGLALTAAATAANAQTVFTREIVEQPATTIIAQQPLITVPTATVQTTETIRTVRPVRRVVQRQVVTTRTITRQRVVSGATVVARSASSYPQPLYDYAGSAPAVVDTDYAPRLYDTADYAPRLYDTGYGPGYTPRLYNYSRRLYDYSPPLYDTVTPVPAPAAVLAPTTTLVAAPAAVVTTPVIYRYVYEPHRILVVDPTTGVAIQAIPR